MESTIKHPFKATTLPLKEMCQDFINIQTVGTATKLTNQKIIAQGINYTANTKEGTNGQKREDIVSFWKLVSLLILQNSVLVFVTFCMIACEVYLLDRKLLFCRLQVVSSRTLIFTAHKELSVTGIINKMI